MHPDEQHRADTLEQSQPYAVHNRFGDPIAHWPSFELALRFMRARRFGGKTGDYLVNVDQYDEFRGDDGWVTSHGLTTEEQDILDSELP